MQKTVKFVLQKARDFLRAKRGNVAMMFGICLVPLTIAAGAGVDFFRASMVRNAMSEALDAAALAVGSTSGLTSTSAAALAQKYFAANYTGSSSEGSPTCCTVTYNSTGSVTVSATDQMPATLLKVVGYTQLPVTASSTVVWGQSKLWVALVLDNSGSMSQGDSSGSKMTALQNASNQLLTILQNASSTAGDVQVSIVPFVKNVNMGASAFVNSPYIDWTDWEAPPAGITVSSSVGPGSACPFSTYSNGFGCTSGSANGSSSVSTIPSSGLICPGIHVGGTTDGMGYHYYNGCWNSTPTTSTSTVTGTITNTNLCTNSTSCTTASYCGGYPNSSTVVVGNVSTTTTNTCACNTTSGSKKTCVKTVTPVITTTTTGAPYTHTWTANDHSTWSGCVMDRQRNGQTTNGASAAASQDYDITNTTPNTSVSDSLFPAENNQYCNTGSSVTTLSYNWTALSNQINAMNAYGATNQAIGMEHGWQTLTPGMPYGAPTVPANTSRYIIIVSDGLNTMDRWYGDGSTENTTQDGYIDTRMNSVCTAAKADGITVYSIYVNIGGSDGNSAPLQNCASDSTKFFALTTTSAIVTTFNQIAQQITNVRVSK